MSVSGKPAISVIIPTHNRRRLLQQTLAALERQHCPADSFEVLVVADGCTDDTDAMVRALQPGYALHFIEQDALGVTPARNRGAELSRAPLLLHLDDDVEACPELVPSHLRAQQGTTDQVVLAPYILEWHERPSFHQIERQTWWSDRFFELSRPGHRFAFSDLSAGNFSLPAALYARLGGFDPIFVGYGGKDYELGARLLKAGAELTFCAAALGYHRDEQERNIDRALRRTRRQARNEVRLGRLHPELRPALPMTGVDYPQQGLKYLLRSLAFTAPILGDRLAERLRARLDWQEWLGRRTAWQSLSADLRFYWYCRGVAEELGTGEQLAAYVQAGRQAASQVGREIELDLHAGLAYCEARLDRERPDGLQLRYGTLPVTRMPPEPGAEALRGRHLRPLLAQQRHAWPLALSKAMSEVYGNQTG